MSPILQATDGSFVLGNVGRWTLRSCARWNAASTHSKTFPHKTYDGHCTRTGVCVWFERIQSQC